MPTRERSSLRRVDGQYILPGASAPWRTDEHDTFNKLSCGFRGIGIMKTRFSADWHYLVAVTTIALMRLSKLLPP